MFETFNVPAFYTVYQESLSSTVQNRTYHGFSSQPGNGITHTVPIYEGSPIEHGVLRLDLAGRVDRSFDEENIDRERVFLYDHGWTLILRPSTLIYPPKKLMLTYLFGILQRTEAKGEWQYQQDEAEKKPKDKTSRRWHKGKRDQDSCSHQIATTIAQTWRRIKRRSTHWQRDPEFKVPKEILLTSQLALLTTPMLLVVFLFWLTLLISFVSVLGS